MENKAGVAGQPGGIWPRLEAALRLIWRWRGVSKPEGESAEASGRLVSNPSPNPNPDPNPNRDPGPDPNPNPNPNPNPDPNPNLWAAGELAEASARPLSTWLGAAGAPRGVLRGELLRRASAMRARASESLT